MDQKQSIFKNGLPYEPDVNRLKEAFPAPEENQVIKHEVIEAIIKEKRGSRRYYALLKSWNRYLFNSLGIRAKVISGVGIKILPPHERMSESENQIRKGLRDVKRGFILHRATDRERLDDLGKQRYDHLTMVNSKLELAINDQKKQMAIEIPANQSLPKPKLIKSA